MTDQGAPTPSARTTPKEFGFSALVTGFARMWRGTGPALIVIVVNAIVQGLLTFWNPQVSLSPAFVVAFVISGAVLLLTLAALARVGLNAVTGKVSVASVVAGVKKNLLNFVLWALIVLVIVLAGVLLNPVLGLLLAWLTVFVPVAAADGKHNALVANFLVIKERWGRWLLTGVIIFIGLVVWLLLAAVNVFFITGFAASIIAWLVTGLLFWWLLTAWALIYRSTRVGAAQQ